MGKDTLYTVGGTTGYSYSIDVYKLDLMTFEWEALFIANGSDDAPAPRYAVDLSYECVWSLTGFPYLN